MFKSNSPRSAAAERRFEQRSVFKKGKRRRAKYAGMAVRTGPKRQNRPQKTFWTLTKL
jgi:hypothetical protein